MTVTCYTDADFATDKTTRKSVSGATIMVNGALISWHCKQQSANALSTTEAEFVAAAVGVREMLGVKELLTEISVKVALPMTIKIDNQAAIKQVENEASNSSSKHVDVKHKFVTGASKDGIIKAVYVGSNKNVADLLTKALPAPRVCDLRGALGLGEASDCLEGV